MLPFAIGKLVLPVHCKKAQPAAWAALTLIGMLDCADLCCQVTKRFSIFICFSSSGGKREATRVTSHSPKYCHSPSLPPYSGHNPSPHSPLAGAAENCPLCQNSCFALSEQLSQERDDKAGSCDIKPLALPFLSMLLISRNWAPCQDTGSKGPNSGPWGMRLMVVTSRRASSKGTTSGWKCRGGRLRAELLSRPCSLLGGGLELRISASTSKVEFRKGFGS